MLDYQDFLASKKTVAQTSGIDVSLSAIHPKLFPFQKELVRWALRKGRAALFADTGTGKSLMQVEFARLTGKRALIVAPLSVARQTVNEAKKIDAEVHYTRSGSDLIDGLNITNYEMISHFNPDDFGCVVLDECFAPDTLIDTLNGPVPIKDIHVGDFIRNAAGIDQVSDIHRREVQYAVRITINGKPIISSPNHPYFTQRGWVGAQDLQPGDSLIHTPKAVRILREGIYAKDEAGRKTQKVLQQILLSELADEATGTFGESTQFNSGREARQEQECLACIGQSQSGSRKGKDSFVESYEQSSIQSEILPKIERDEAQTFRAWGKWDGVNITTANTSGCTWKRMDSGVCLVTGSTDSGVSHLLQDRYREYQSQNSYRSGWALSSQSQREGSEEGCEIGFSRVDSLEVLQLGHPDLERLRDADGHVYLYDIGATQHPSFSVNGYLVHNSSILKSVEGAIRTKLMEMFQNTPYRLCCTATPAPNDHVELGNHAEFLGIMTTQEMKAMFMTHDSNTSAHGGWRLKGHAEQAFYKWLASWSMSVKKPSDLGSRFSDEGYNLPPLHVERAIVTCDYVPQGQLFFAGLKGVSDRAKVRKGTLEERVLEAVKLIEDDKNNEQWIVWCGLNDESTTVTKAIDGAVELKGKDSPEKKIQTIEDFQNGKIRVLVTKAKIAGMGINLQNCHNQIFLGLNDSFELYYQCVRRSLRFGQKYPVYVYIVLSDIEEEIFQNVLRKEEEAKKMSDELIKNVQQFEKNEIERKQEEKFDYQEKTIKTDDYTLMLGDSCERLKEVASNSIELLVSSIPFEHLYTYSPSERDLGNCRSSEEFFTHLGYIINELMRVMKPCRNVCIHVSQIPLTLIHDGVIGIRDFRGDVIRAFVDHGFIYHSDITVDKDPQVAASRSHAKGLAFQQLDKDTIEMRSTFADYILVFKKPGKNAVPIKQQLSRDEWIKWASAVWYGIRQTDTLNVVEAREAKDEMHICPLQLDLIERLLRLYSNPGETVIDPFAGIGSTGYVALELDRKFLGIELKSSYFKTAHKNLERMLKKRTQTTLWAFAEAEAV